MVKSALRVANQMWGFCYSDNKVLNRISTLLTSNSYSSNTLRRLSGTISFKPIQSRKKLVNGSFMVFTWRHGGHVGTPKNSSEVQWGLNTFFMQNFRLFQEIWITTDQVRESWSSILYATYWWTCQRSSGWFYEFPGSLLKQLFITYTINHYYCPAIHKN